ncbi:MAG: hypothetical protein PHI27_09420 [Eubacteriales bacterium]|nr:hypothetical protein [Eubacteriales bacterium]MDD3882460.1 hypothetical protein [Eubacteriales bacterium]MDD4513182.1 hypothetical protein [Eubacteriales bacterium]
MNSRNKPSEDFRTQSDLAYDMLMREYFEKEAERLQSEIAKEKKEGGESDADRFFKANQEKHYRLILKKVKPRRRKALSRVAVFSRVAVVFAAVLVLVSSAVTAGIESKTNPLKMTVVSSNTGSSIEISRNMNVRLNVPEEWKGGYYLSYIPEGFELAKIKHKDDNFDEVKLRLDNDIFYEITFTVRGGYDLCLSDSDVVNIDVNLNSARQWNETIRGNDCFIASRWKRFTAFWIDGVNVLELVTEGLSESEFRDILMGIVRIKY